MSIGKLLNKLQLMGIAVDGDCAVAVNVARELKICHFPHASTPVFLRVLKRSKGEKDFSNLAFLGSRLGSRINEPSRIVTTDEFICGFFPFVAHDRPSRKRLVSGELLLQVRDALVLMHTAGQDFAAENRSPLLRPVIDIADAECQFDAMFKRYMATNFRDIVGGKAPVAQHCDFTYVNLGITDDCRVIIFDWEEYGAIQYPGFDFATFLVSHHYHGGTIDDVLSSPEGLTRCIDRDFGNEFLGSIGLTTADFTRLFPAYIYVFLTLKREGFGATINTRIRAMLDRILESESWTRIMAAECT